MLIGKKCLHLEINESEVKMSDYDSWKLQTPEEYSGLSVDEEIPFDSLVCLKCNQKIEFFYGQDLPENFDDCVSGTEEYMCLDCEEE